MIENSRERQSNRTTVRRGSKRADYENDNILRILRAGSVAHVGVTTADGPLVLPMVYGLSDDAMYLHGALANSILKAGTDADICATVTIVDGLVIAKTSFNHSMNYRSVVVRGHGRIVDNHDEVLRALQLITNHIIPTWDITRPPSPSEIRATRIVALSLNEKSAKVRTGGAVNEVTDADGNYWSGHIPIASIFGSAVSDADARAEIPDVVQRKVGQDIHLVTPD